MTTRETVAALFGEELALSPSRFEDATTFDGDLSLDSLDGIRLVMKLEDALHVEIGDDEWADVDTFGKAVALVERKLAERVAA